MNGWTKAWKEIFDILENSSDDLENNIKKKSDELWSKYKYEKNEEDRVILLVSLEALNVNDEVVWAGSYELDESGSGENTAMALLVSITLTAGIDLILKKKLEPGVQAAPSSKTNIDYFFKILKDYNVKLKKIMTQVDFNLSIIRESRKDETRTPLAPKHIKELKNYFQVLI